jgi:anti-anti-sigma regulatory factor
MRLQLTQEQGVAILSVHGEFDSAKAPALRAGILKYLRDGKNRIVLDFADTSELPTDALREIIKLHLAATELKGAIVIVGQGDRIRQAIETFATPPPVKYFPSREAAARFFAEASAAAVAAEGPPAVGPAADLERELRAKITELERANKTLAGRVLNQDADALKAARSEVTLLKHRLAAMSKELRTLLGRRKAPAGDAALRARVAELEAALLEYTEKGAKAAPGAAARK